MARSALLFAVAAVVLVLGYAAEEQPLGVQELGEEPKEPTAAIDGISSQKVMRLQRMAVGVAQRLHRLAQEHKDTVYRLAGVQPVCMGDSSPAEALTSAGSFLEMSEGGSIPLLSEPPQESKAASDGAGHPNKGVMARLLSARATAPAKWQVDEAQIAGHTSKHGGDLYDGAVARMLGDAAAEMQNQAAKSGTGTVNIEPVLQAITNLEGEIRAEAATDKQEHESAQAECTRQNSAFMASIGVETEYQAHMLLVEEEAHDNILQSRQDRDASKAREEAIEEVLNDLRVEKKLQYDAYLARRLKRRQDIKVLHTAVALVCTFQSFENDRKCKLNNLSRSIFASNTFSLAVPYPVKSALNTDKSEHALAHEQAAAVSNNEAAWQTTVASDITLAKTGQVSDADQPHQNPATMKRELSLLQIGSTLSEAVTNLGSLVDEVATEKAASPVRMLLLSLKSGDYDTSSSLLELVLGLIDEIETTQKSDAAATEKKQGELSDQIKEQEEIRETEQTLQDNKLLAIAAGELKVQGALYGSKEEGRGYFQSIVLAEKLAHERIVHRDNCRLIARQYRNRKVDREEELGNINRLRSLLRVLAGDTSLPDCSNTNPAGLTLNSCTSASQGQCVFMDNSLQPSQGKCICEWENYDIDCAKFKCPGADQGRLYKVSERDACDGIDRGTCNSATGTCTCKTGYYGDTAPTGYNAPPWRASCQYIKNCPGGGDCSDGNGSCSHITGKCTCRQDFFGEGCEYKKCPGAGPLKYSKSQSEVCSGHGLCEGATGTCTCHDHWSGPKCDQHHCPSDCSGEGDCNYSTGQCVCKAGRTGADCAYKTCPANCGGSANGRCDRDAGVCVCNPGFSGPECQKSTTCDAVETTYRDWMMSRAGWSKCPWGTLLTGFKTSTCTSIECLDKAHCAKPCHGGTRVGIGECYQAHWWTSFNTGGWSKCREPYYLAGVYRNTCRSLYCIEVGYCCLINGASYDQCQQHTWSGSMKSQNAWAKVPVNRFVTGLHREGKDATIHDMDKASACNFKMDPLE
jgi:hypothetical protein